MSFGMGVIGGDFGYRLLRRISADGETGYCDGSVYHGVSKLEKLLGERIWEETKDKVVIDFGCGDGDDAVELAERGARKVIGIDIREHALAKATQTAAARGVAERCTFGTQTDEKADVIVSLDAFEHFADPAAILRVMRNLVKDEGCLIAAFGPTWYHPLGGHLFSPFPWAHLLFTEKSLIRWRSDFKTDGATRFCEAEGGLNQMTIRRFKALVDESDFKFEEFEAVPVRRVPRLANRLTQEFTTAIVRCKLVPR
ncbi:MAG TPA: class I SAM-dependent methyltransferase [Pyrinomonadaceae bacterium]|nr:class I SAM-dependent methyltransferase [Pyrinomonadaceae bacterium]